MRRWELWTRQPQSVWARKAVFQVHLWTGLGVGLYILAICVSGSVLVYRNELLRTFTAEPRNVAGSGPLMTVEDLKERGRRAYPEYQVADCQPAPSDNRPRRIADPLLIVLLRDDGQPRLVLKEVLSGAAKHLLERRRLSGGGRDDEV